jgi:hypothetical protein
MTFRMSDDNISFTFGSLLAAIPAISWLWPLQLHAMDAGSMATIWIIKIFGTIILGWSYGYVWERRIQAYKNKTT